MKKFNKVFLMVLVVLMVLAPACKKADVDPVEPSVLKITNVVSGSAGRTAGVDVDWDFLNNSDEYAQIHLMADWGIGSGFIIEGGSGFTAGPGVSQGQASLSYYYDKSGTYTAIIKMRATFKDGSVIYSDSKTITFITQ